MARLRSLQANQAAILSDELPQQPPGGSSWRYLHSYLGDPKTHYHNRHLHHPYYEIKNSALKHLVVTWPNCDFVMTPLHCAASNSYSISVSCKNYEELYLPIYRFSSWSPGDEPSDFGGPLSLQPETNWFLLETGWNDLTVPADVFLLMFSIKTFGESVRLRINTFAVWLRC